MFDVSLSLTAILFGVAIIILLLVVLGFRKLVALRMADRIIRDPDTGVFTADFMDEVYQAELLRAERTGVPFSLALVVPHVMPHPGRSPAADVGMPSVVKRLQQHLRGADYIGRLQDNRFVIIMPETWEEDARSVAARMSAAFRFMGGSGKWVSCDIGIATWQPEKTDVWAIAEKQLTAATTVSQN